ncbi:methyl-accepting chemotaxis sensory transducer with GAF sensor [Klenkia marina]|uniref:Methyl-accepting chemotaxis sensory transducer with GAF sensor n=1 Tax=Klenkia marina TaxID=1960309 RepID=A0A1G4Y8F2_9ACTN|nr:GAF domain-containing protein [Klenkia marina]SCX49659.1 methyl-accepting chemotaxis sensory transducer with GAF sensor [Klenkia marina]
MFRQSTPSPAVETPRDVEALERVIEVLDAGVVDERDAYRRTTETLVAELGLCYGAIWLPDGEHLVVAGQYGPLVPAMAQAPGSRGEQVARTVGFGGVAVRTGKPVVLDDSSDGDACLRWQAAVRGGATQGCVLPVVEGGAVVALLEYYSSTPLPFFGGRGTKWQALGRLIAHARRAALASAALQETVDDRSAVTTVVRSVGEATDARSALRAALESVRTAFGWAYGSYWALDPQTRTLRFDTESGSAGTEFREVTLAASFAEGVGLSGRAWRARDLVFVRDLAELTDCVRAPAAQRAGVRSGVCFPVVVGGEVIGTMDFFTTATIELSESRSSALRNVAQLVSQRLDGLHRAERDAANARALSETIGRLRQAADDAGRVADAAVAQARAMASEVDALDEASTSVGDVIRIISRIADQTNLLALNATIEAARAGELGRGFAVVANEVKELARETAGATQRVSEQITGMQETTRSVSAGILSTSDEIARLGDVQARMNDVLEEQARMAAAFDA